MKITLLIYLSILLLHTACGRLLPDEASAQRVLPASPSEIKVSGSESILHNINSSAWEAHSTILKGQKILRAVFFLDEHHGWAGGIGGTLYKTDDGGANWQRVRMESPAGVSIRNIFFLNEAVGWIVLQKPARNILDYDEPYFRLLQTKDGGRSWQLQYEAEAAEVFGLSFVDEQRAWLTGVKYEKPALYTYLVLHTIDQGQHWEDASADLKRIVSGRTNRQPDELNDAVMGVALTDASTTKVITGDLEIFKTSNDGRSWLEVGTIQNKFGLSSVVRRLGIKEGKYLWSVGGTSGPDGTRGLLFIEQDEHSWVKYILSGVFFTDAVSLSKNQFLACGFILKTESVGQKYRTHREGIILHSIDNGKNWEIVYQNPQIQSINAIASVGDELAWAVGENGLIIKLDSLK